MISSRTSGSVVLVYFDEVIKNKGLHPEIYYDCSGHPVYILPGESGTVRRVKREFIKNPSKTFPTSKDFSDGKKQEHSEG